MEGWCGRGEGKKGKEGVIVMQIVRHHESRRKRMSRWHLAGPTGRVSRVGPGHDLSVPLNLRRVWGWAFRVLDGMASDYESYES